MRLLTSMSSTLLRWYYRAFGSATLRDYEEAVLNAWAAQLSPEAAALLRTQLTRYDFVQRQSKDKLLCFYWTEMRQASEWPGQLLFPLRTEAQVVAVASLRSERSPTDAAIRVNIELFKGRLFSLVFSQPPALLEGNFVVTHVEMTADPMRHGAHHESLNAHDASAIVAAITAKLPDEYLDMISGTSEHRINGWIVHGLDQLTTLVQPDKNYFVLAEKDTVGAIVVADGDLTGRVFFLDTEGDTPRIIEGSLREFCASH